MLPHDEVTGLRNSADDTFQLDGAALVVELIPYWQPSLVGDLEFRHCKSQSSALFETETLSAMWWIWFVFKVTSERSLRY